MHCEINVTNSWSTLKEQFRSVSFSDDMILIALTKSKEQHLTHGEMHPKQSFKIEANVHLSIFIIKVCEIYLLYTLKIGIHS